jgi:hypothetical protein
VRQRGTELQEVARQRSSGEVRWWRDVDAYYTFFSVKNLTVVLPEAFGFVPFCSVLHLYLKLLFAKHDILRNGFFFRDLTKFLACCEKFGNSKKGLYISLTKTAQNAQGFKIEIVIFFFVNHYYYLLIAIFQLLIGETHSYK